jgi:hypothetical protein
MHRLDHSYQTNQTDQTTLNTLLLNTLRLIQTIHFDRKYLAYRGRRYYLSDQSVLTNQTIPIDQLFLIDLKYLTVLIDRSDLTNQTILIDL